MLRSLDKERFEIRTEWLGKAKIEEPFKSVQKTISKQKKELYDETGNIIEIVLEDKINLLEKEWTKFRSALKKVKDPRPSINKQKNLHKLAKSRMQNAEKLRNQQSDSNTRIKSEKNPALKGDITKLYEQSTKLLNKKKSVLSTISKQGAGTTNINKPHIKPVKQSNARKNISKVNRVEQVKNTTMKGVYMGDGFSDRFNT